MDYAQFNELPEGTYSLHYVSPVLTNGIVEIKGAIKGALSFHKRQGSGRKWFEHPDCFLHYKDALKYREDRVLEKIASLKQEKSALETRIADLSAIAVEIDRQFVEIARAAYEATKSAQEAQDGK